MTPEPELTRAVFVPGLMGAGILLSAGLLLADGIRKVTPNRGARRKLLVARGVRSVVTAAAEAAGLRVSTAELTRREPRARWVYITLFAVLGAAAGFAVRAGTDAFFGPGTLHDNPWAIGIGAGAGLLLGSFALIGLVLAVLGRTRGPLRRLVEETPVGRLRPPPEDQHERAHLLVPEFHKGEER